MSELPYFEVVGDHAEYRPAGRVSLAEGVRMITSALALARERRIEKLLVVTTGLTGFASPNLTERFFFMQEWAQAAGQRVQAALVASPEMIDPGRFGVTVAANRCFNADVFATEKEALDWLLG